MPIVPEGVHFALRLIKGSLTTFNHSLEPSCEFDANWHHFFKMMPIGIILSVIINGVKCRAHVNFHLVKLEMLIHHYCC